MRDKDQVLLKLDSFRARMEDPEELVAERDRPVYRAVIATLRWQLEYCEEIELE